MKTYTVRHKELLVKDFEIEANSPDEAIRKFWDLSANGELDFSDENLIESSEEVLEDKN